MPRLFTEAPTPKAPPSATIQGQDTATGVSYGQSTGPGEPLEAALLALEGMNQRNWKKIQDTVAGQIRQAKEWMDVKVVRKEQVPP